MPRVWALVGSLAVVAFPVSALAAVDLRKLEINLVEQADLFGLLARLIDFILLGLGVVAFFFVLYGGALYLTAGGDPAGVNKAKQTILNALIGIIIIAFSYTLVRFIVAQTQSDFRASPAPTSTPRSRR